jgi:membrane fusion protein (multidrug efflux system)
MKNFLLVLAVFLYSCSNKPADAPAAQATPVEVVTISHADAKTQNDYTAAIEGKVNVEIRPQVEGYLQKVYVDEGAFVKAGQPLFKIDERPYREAMNNAQASLHAAEAAVANAQLEIDKITPLVQNKVVSDVQLKTAQASFRVAKANAEQAKAQVAAAQINIGYTTITAPVSGYIGRLPKKQGALVSRADAEALTQLSDVHEIYAYFSLSENDFDQFKEQYAGNTLEEKLKNAPPVSLILSDNSVYPTEGKIDMVDGQFDKNTGAITIRAIFANSNGLLRSGNTGKVRLSREHVSAISIPQSATIEIQDKVFVFTVDKANKVTKQPISIIGKSGNDYLIKDGLKDGDVVVSSGFDHLQDGGIVKPEQPKPEDKKLSSLK